MSTMDPEIDSSVSDHTIDVKVTKKPHCQVTFAITVKEPATQAMYAKAIQNINNEFNIPGFRKGKTPVAMIKEKYPAAIEREFFDLILENGFHNALTLTGLHPVKHGKIERPVIHDYSYDKEVHFSITFEAQPKVPSIHVEDLHIPKTTPPVITELDCNNAIHNLLLQHATYEPIEDRPAEENDFIDLTMSILSNPPRVVLNKQRMELNGTGLPAWLYPFLIGVSPGNSIEGMTEKQKNTAEGEPEDESVPFHATVHAIWKGSLPELNDAFAKQLGLSSIDNLHKAIRHQLEKQVQEEVFAEENRALNNTLLQQYIVDIPQSYISDDKEARMNAFLARAEKQKKHYTDEELAHYSNLIEEETIRNLQLYLLLKKAAVEHNITVTDLDLREEYSYQLTLMAKGLPHIDLDNDPENIRRELANHAVERKTRHFLINGSSGI